MITTSANSVPNRPLTSAPAGLCSTFVTGDDSRTRSPSRSASRSARAWLPPATRWLGQRLERGHVVDDVRRQVVGRPGARHLDARAHRLRHLGPDVEPVEQVGDADAGSALAGREGARGGAHVRDRDAVDTARLADVVAHPGVDQREPEAVEPAAHGVVAGEHELRAPLDHRAGAARTVERLGPDPPADPVPRLMDHHVDPGVEEVDRRRQAGEPSPHHRHACHAHIRPDPHPRRPADRRARG